jgi:hypothetical protein
VQQVEKGNTIKIEIEFLDFDGSPVEPDNIVFKVYDAKFLELSSNLLEPNNKVRDSNGLDVPGQYYIDHVFNQTGSFYIEFLGYIDSKPTLKREKVTVVFNE